MRRKVIQIFRASITLGGDLIGQKPVLRRKNAGNDTSVECRAQGTDGQGKKKAKEKHILHEVVYNYQYVS